MTPGKNPASAGAQQETQRVETVGSSNHDHRRRDHAPEHHEQGNPTARADSLQGEVARHLEEEIAGEEHSGAESVNGVGEGELLAHLERGESDVDAIEIRDDVEQEEERDQSPRQLAHDYCVDLVHDSP